MKLKDLSSILYSTRQKIQLVIIYDFEKNIDLERCSIEFAIKYYGDSEIKRITSCFENSVSYLIITI